MAKNLKALCDIRKLEGFVMAKKLTRRHYVIAKNLKPLCFLIDLGFSVIVVVVFPFS
jgi:hypothetical protein